MRRIVGGAVTLALVVGLVVGVYFLVTVDVSNSAGQTPESPGECSGGGFLSDPSSKHLGEHYGKIEAENNTIELEITDATLPHYWTRIISPDGWTSRVSASVEGTRTVTRNATFPCGDYTILALGPGKDPAVYQNETIYLKP